MSSVRPQIRGYSWEPLIKCPIAQMHSLRGFYETAGIVKSFLLLFFSFMAFWFLPLPLLLPLLFAFLVRFISGFYTHSM